MATTMVMRASPDQRNRTKAEEGLRLETYLDTEGIWTIGWGHAETNGIKVRGILGGVYYEGPPAEGVIITTAEAQRLFDFDMDETERDISAMVTAPLAQNQFDCLCDFVHQFGINALGGSTLIGKLNKNPYNLGAADNDTGILHELMRWTRASGEHKEYVWRRSARRACVYNGSPIPQALWRKNGFPFAITTDDKVDYSITPTIYKLIEYGKKAAEPFKFDPAKIVLETPPTPQDELILSRKVEAAAPGGSPVAVGEAPVTPQPKPVASPAPIPNTGVSKPASPGGSLDPMPPTPPKAPPVSSVPKLDPPKPPPVIAPKSIDVRTIPYGDVKPENGAKNMTDSTRVIGLVIVALGSVVQVLAGREIVSSTIGAVFYDLSRDTAFVAVAAGAIALIIGWVTRKRGTHVLTKGMVNATQVLK